MISALLEKLGVDSSLYSNGDHVIHSPIDLLTDKLDRQLIKHKEKYLERQQGVGVR